MALEVPRSDRKVSSPARYRGLQRDPPLFILTLDREQARRPEGIVVLTEQIQIPSDRVVLNASKLILLVGIPS